MNLCTTLTAFLLSHQKGEYFVILIFFLPGFINTPSLHIRTYDFQVPKKADYQTLVPNLIKYHKSLTSVKDDGASYTFNGGR